MTPPPSPDAPDQQDGAEPGDVVIIGAGPAGLTAAYALGQRGVTSTVLEADRRVGGISRTVERDGWRFDIGGHRFFTKVKPVEELWHEILDDGDFILPPRMSRIYYDGKYFDYPLKAFNALRNLGLIEAFLCVLSYLWVRVRPPKDQDKFEGWIAARFGWRLYRTFFKTYTEKVWGIPADGDARGLGGPAHQEPLALQGGAQRPPAQPEPEGDHQPHRGVRVPQVRPGDDVGAVHREGAGPGLVGRACRPGSIGIRHDGGRAVAVRGGGPEVPLRQRHLLDAVHPAAQGHGPPGAGRRPRRGRRPPVPGLPHRRARRARGGRVPGQLDLHPRSRGPGRSHPELRLVVAVPGQGRPDLPRPRVLRLRGRRALDVHRRGPRRPGRRGSW